MSTATAEPQTETITFLSRSPNQVLTRRSTRYIQDGESGKRVLSESEWIAQQEDANTARLAQGKDPVDIDRTPWKVEFQNNLFSTDNPQLIKWLREHTLFNVPHGFYEQGKAPDEPRPTMTEQMTEIADASAFGDLERVQKALDLERDTHNRLPILEAAGAAVKRLEELGFQADANAGNSKGDSSSTSPPSPDA
jgi:hypothetical protein